MKPVRVVLRSAHRALTDENVDLWLLTAAAAVFTVLGIIDIAKMNVLSSAILALLAALAFAQIKSRKLVAQLAKSSSASGEVLLRDFPADLARQRAEADEILLIGIAMARTIQGSRDDLYRALTRGAKLRVLLLDPSDMDLVRQGALVRPPGRAALLAQRIRSTLDELVELKTGTGGDLEIRVAQFVPPLGVNLLRGAKSASITIQHTEHHPVGEPGPIMHFEESASGWFSFYERQADRLWAAGTPWPPTHEQQLGAIARPSFIASFGPELITSMESAQDLFITGVARNTLLTENYTKFERWLQRGCRIRMLLIEPTSAAVEVAAERYYAERSPASTRARIEQSLRLLAELAATTGGELEVRRTDHPIPIGVIAVDTPQQVRGPSSAIFVEYYTFQAEGEPKFVLQPSDPWFDQFLAEAEQVWKGASS